MFTFINAVLFTLGHSISPKLPLPHQSSLHLSDTTTLNTTTMQSPPLYEYSHRFAKTTAALLLPHRHGAAAVADPDITVTAFTPNW